MIEQVFVQLSQFNAQVGQAVDSRFWQTNEKVCFKNEIAPKNGQQKHKTLNARGFIGTTMNSVATNTRKNGHPQDVLLCAVRRGDFFNT